MNERDLLARMIQAEAGNQGYLGMLAVGSVIDNRRRSPGYGGSDWRSVMLAPGQFSPANSITGYAGGEQGVNLASLRPSEDAWKVADMVLAGEYDDPTGGALNFVNPDISQPSWLKTMGNTVKIGDHLFGTAGTGEGASGRPGGRKPNQDIADEAMAAIGKEPVRQPVSQPSGGNGDTTLLGGLLNIGDDMAEYEPERAGGLLGRMFPNMTADRRDQIKMGLAGMSLNPNQALISSLESRMDGRSEDRKEFKTLQKQQEQTNKTLQMMRQAGVPEEQIQLAAVNPDYMKAILGQVIKSQYEKPDAPTPYSAPAKLAADYAAGLITREQYDAAIKGENEPDQPEYGLTPQYVTRPDGSLGMIQLGKDGSVNEVELPEGMALQKGVEKLDLGTAWQWYNTVTAEPIGDPIPKDNRGAAADTAAGTVEGKDEAEKAIAAPGVIAEAQNLESLIESVINDPALPSVVGNVQGRLPAGSPFNGGQAGANVQAKIDQIGGKAFLQAFESLKGGGQITEREGAAAQAAMARMNQTQDQATFTASLRELQAIARNARLRAQGQDVPEYTGGGTSAPSAGPQPSYDPQTPDFSTMSDEELQAYIERGGQ